MSTRMIRTLAIAAGAGALVLSAAAPAMAANTDVTTLPGKVALNSATKDTAKVTITQPGVCANWAWDAPKFVGQKNSGVTIVAAVPCADDLIKGTFSIGWTVEATTAPANKRQKANAVVKFIANPTEAGMLADVAAEKQVYSLVVKVNKNKGKPAKTAKPGEASETS